MKKALLWIVAVLVGLVVIGYGALLLFFPAERLRVYLEETGAEYTGQPVSIGDLSVSLWGGIGVTLDSVVVGEESDSLRLAQISDIDVKVRFWPLLSGEYVVDRLIVTRPRLMLVRFADGTSNFAVTAPSEPGAAPETVESEAGVLLGGLSFGTLEIREGALRRLDQSTGADSYLFGLDFEGSLTPTAPDQFTSNGTVAWSSLRHQGSADEKPISLPAMSVKYAVDYDAQADALRLMSLELTSAAGVVAVDGVIEGLSADSRASLNYRASGLSLAELFAAAPELTAALPVGWGAQAELAVSGVVAYANDTLTYNGAGALTECVVSAAGTDVTLTSTRIDFAFSQDSLAVSADRLAAKEASLKFEAGLSDFAAPRLRLKAQGGAPLALLGGYLPQGGEPQLGGVANVDLAVSGALAQPERMNISGSLKVHDGSLRATTLPEQLERFTCDIGVAPKKITINALSLQFERSDIALTGEISDPFPYLLPVADSTKEKFPGPYLQFTATSHRFDVDRLFPEAAPGTGVNRASMPLDSVPPILLPEVNGAGVARFDTLIYSEVQFTNVTSDVRIERTRIFCDNIRGTAYSGAVTGNTVIDLTDFDNPMYYGGFNAEQVSAAEVLKRFLPWDIGDYLVGQIKLSGDYSSAGWEPAEFLQALTMNVDAFGAGMELRNAPLANQWIENLVQTTGKTQLRDKYRTISLKSFQGAFKMEKGRIVVNDLAGEAASLGSWKLSGGMGLDGALDLGGSFVPSQQLISELAGDNALAGALAEYLKDPSSGQISAPLTVGGTVEKPVAQLDLSAVESKIGEALKKQAGDALKGLFKKR